MKKIIAGAALTGALMGGCTSPEQSEAEFYPYEGSQEMDFDELLIETENCVADIPEMGSEPYIAQTIESFQPRQVTEDVHYHDLTGMPECDYVDLVNSLVESVYEANDTGPYAFANRFSAKTFGEDAELLSIVTKQTDYTVASPIIFGDIVMRYTHGDDYTESQLHENAYALEELFYTIAEINTIEHEEGYLFDLIIIDYEELTDILDNNPILHSNDNFEESQQA